MDYKLKTAPAIEPVTLKEAKAHLRVTDTNDDLTITALIRSARMMVEQITNRQLITATWELYLDRFPEDFDDMDDALQLFPAPVINVSEITYVDTSGVTQVWPTTDWRMDYISEPSRLTPAYGKSWPSVREMTNSVKMTFTAGYGSTTASVPEPIKEAMKLLIGHWFENHEEVVIGRISSQLPLASKYLLDPYRVNIFR